MPVPARTRYATQASQARVPRCLRSLVAEGTAAVASPLVAAATAASAQAEPLRMGKRATQVPSLAAVTAVCPPWIQSPRIARTPRLGMALAAVPDSSVVAAAAVLPTATAAPAAAARVTPGLLPPTRR